MGVNFYISHNHLHNIELFAVITLSVTSDIYLLYKTYNCEHNHEKASPPLTNITSHHQIKYYIEQFCMVVSNLTTFGLLSVIFLHIAPP